MAIPLSYNFRNLLQRRTTTLMTALGIALAVAVMLGILGMLAGLESSFQATGHPLQVMVLRKGSTAELSSAVSREELKHWGDLVAAAGRRYDGHPYLESVDISSVGYWGEGWSPYMPAFPHQKALIDIWFDAFPRTLLLMNFDEPQALAYGVSRGAGWRLDCLGDMRSGWCHMLDIYPEQVVRAGVQDPWQRSHVSLETSWVPGHWKKQGWDVDYAGRKSK